MVNKYTSVALWAESLNRVFVSLLAGQNVYAGAKMVPPSWGTGARH